MIIGVNGNEANVELRVGVNQYAHNILKTLEILPEAKKHKFIIYLSSKPGSHLPKERIGWKYKIFKKSKMWVFSVLTPHLLITGEKPDVFFTPNHYSPILFNIPSIISVMDLGYLTSKQHFKTFDFLQLKYWTNLSIWQAKKILAISESARQEILKYYPKASLKIEVTLLAYDKNKFNRRVLISKVSEVKKKYNIKGDYILFLGTLKPNKNIERVIEAFLMLSSLPLTLVIAGKKGWLYEKIFNLVDQLQLSSRVIFTDFVSEEDKPALLKGASALVSPSLWEGFGIHLLESMAVGTPVVTSDVGSVREVCKGAAVYVDPLNPSLIADGIRKALLKNEHYEKQGYIQSKKFSWEQTALKTLQILESAGA